MAAVPGVRSRANAALPFRVERRMVVGIALVGVSLAGGLVLWRGATDTTMVVVAARDIPPGHVIQRDEFLRFQCSLRSSELGIGSLQRRDPTRDDSTVRPTDCRGASASRTSPRSGTAGRSRFKR